MSVNIAKTITHRKSAYVDLLPVDARDGYARDIGRHQSFEVRLCGPNSQDPRPISRGSLVECLAGRNLGMRGTVVRNRGLGYFLVDFDGTAIACDRKHLRALSEPEGAQA